MANPCAKCQTGNQFSNHKKVYCEAQAACQACARAALCENAKLERAIRWYHDSGEPLASKRPEARTINAVCFPKSKAAR